MKALWVTLVKNLSNIMGLVGIFLSIYFGVFYVPEWLEDAEKQKIINAEINIEQSIKELIYSDSTCTFNEIQTLVKAKEIELGKVYPFSIEQILIKVESSFMNDRFLPLEKRRSLIKESQLIRSAIPKPPVVHSENKKSFEALSLISIITSIAAGLGGAIGFFLRFKKERETQEEIDNQTLNIETEPAESTDWKSFEQEIISTLRNFPGVKVKSSESVIDNVFDIVFEYNNKTFFVEVKYLSRSLVGLATIEKFFRHQKGLQGEFWLICNTGLTKMSTNRFNELSALFAPRRESKIIEVNSAEEFGEILHRML